MKDNMNKNIFPKNQKGQLHGYAEYYYKNKISYRTIYKNGENISYSEWHGMRETIFFIK